MDMGQNTNAGLDVDHRMMGMAGAGASSDHPGRMWPVAGSSRTGEEVRLRALSPVVVPGRAPRERPEDDEVLIVPVRPAVDRGTRYERPEDDEVLVAASWR